MKGGRKAYIKEEGKEGRTVCRKCGRTEGQAEDCMKEGLYEGRREDLYKGRREGRKDCLKEGQKEGRPSSVHFRQSMATVAWHDYPKSPAHEWWQARF
jgi:hypothetical protein